eukprot:PhF_6_TR5213/c0_g1_i2/m.7519
MAQSNTTHGVKNSAEDTDQTFVPLQKLAYDYIGGQAYAVEVTQAYVYSYSHAVVFSNLEYEADIKGFLKELAEQFTPRDLRGMTGFVRSNPMIKWVEGERLLHEATKHKDALQKWATRDEFLIDLMRQDKDIAAILSSFPCVILSTDTGGTTKGETFTFNIETTSPTDVHIMVFQKYISLEKNRVADLMRVIESRVAKAHKAPPTDWKSVMHSLRVSHEIEEVLQRGKVEFPLRPEVIQHLLKVKKGEFPLQECCEAVEQRMERIKAMEGPKQLLVVDRDKMVEKLEDWLSTWMMRLYRIVQQA